MKIGIRNEKGFGSTTNSTREVLSSEDFHFGAGKFHPSEASEDDCWLGKVHIVRVGAQKVPRLGSAVEAKCGVSAHWDPRRREPMLFFGF